MAHTFARSVAKASDDIDLLGERQDLRVSYHEAGHIACALHHGVSVISATIDPDPTLGFHGHVYTEAVGIDLQHPPNRIPAALATRIDVECMTRLAGSAAEQRMFGNARQQGTRHPYSDPVMVRRYASIRCLSPSEVSAYLAWLRIRVENILARPDVWQGVEALAVALLRHRTLDASEIAAVWSYAVKPAPSNSTGG